MKIVTSDFGLGASLIRLTNEKGVSIAFTNLGARIVSFQVDGKEIVLGFDSAKEYLTKDPYPGATIGRTAGRIKDGIIELSGQKIQLNQNDFPQNIHGGATSFHTKLWTYEIFEEKNKVRVKFYLTSNDGENGYPGKLDVEVTHTFDEASCWSIDYDAVSDRDTVFNPTGHVYFNLNGDASQSVSNHSLQIAASRFIPLLDHSEIVRGDVMDVAGTAMDFRKTQLLENALKSEDAQIQLVGGIDHPFLLDEVNENRVQAHLSLGNLSISVSTDRPSIVIFTANFGDLGTIYHGKAQVHHGGITFETQVAPGSQQIPELGEITLKKGERYHSTTRYQFNDKNYGETS